MLDHVTPFFALVSAVLVLLPLPWHIRSRNVGTVALSTWLFLGNVDNFVNSMVWWNSTSDKAPVFCELILAFRWFWIRRRQFQAVLASSASNINRSRYIRLLLLTAADRLIFFPIYVGTIGKEIADAITLPYGSWSSVHAGFDERPQFKADVIEMQSTFKRNLILSRLVSPLSGYIFFAMFGLGQEACQGYKNALRRILVFCKLQKERKQPTPQAIVADIEVVTFQSRDTYSAAGASPSSEKFGAHAAKYEAA
uniref:A2-pheromone receptor Pra1 n=1 Tax=Melanopsichium pennsylvanicum 4 TaxID=1398559 RepID=A0A077R802_9BASI|nr:a2-pheromone receptor Pra1 [Melanopsichium pennsylvanicum 4]